MSIMEPSTSSIQTMGLSSMQLVEQLSFVDGQLRHGFLLTASSSRLYGRPRSESAVGWRLPPQIRFYEKAALLSVVLTGRKPAKSYPPPGRPLLEGGRFSCRANGDPLCRLGKTARLLPGLPPGECGIR